LEEYTLASRSGLHPEKFFDELPLILKQVPPMPGEEALYATFQSIDAAKDPKLKQTLTATAVAAEKDLISPLFDFHMNGRPIGNGWNSPPNGANCGYDYLSRAATAKSNIYDNAPQETRYIYTDFAPAASGSTALTPTLLLSLLDKHRQSMAFGPLLSTTRNTYSNPIRFTAIHWGQRASP
jgi:hypothetical protein